MAKVIFLHLSVILFTGGVCLSACWDTPRDQTPGPPRTRPQASPQTRHPLDQTPPGTRHPPDKTPPLGPDPRPPRSRQPPPREQTTPLPPPGKQTPAYGLRAAGTHSTGMHSCYVSNFSVLKYTLKINKPESLSIPYFRRNRVFPK